MPEPGRTATGVNFRDPGLSIWVMRRRPGGLGFFFLIMVRNSLDKNSWSAH